MNHFLSGGPDGHVLPKRVSSSESPEEPAKAKNSKNNEKKAGAKPKPMKQKKDEEADAEHEPLGSGPRRDEDPDGNDQHGNGSDQTHGDIPMKRPAKGSRPAPKKKPAVGTKTGEMEAGMVRCGSICSQDSSFKVV